MFNDIRSQKIGVDPKTAADDLDGAMFGKYGRMLNLVGMEGMFRPMSVLEIAPGGLNSTPLFSCRRHLASFTLTIRHSNKEGHFERRGNWDKRCLIVTKTIECRQEDSFPRMSAAWNPQTEPGQMELGQSSMRDARMSIHGIAPASDGDEGVGGHVLQVAHVLSPGALGPVQGVR